MRCIYYLILVIFTLSESFGQSVEDPKKVGFVELGLFVHSVSLPLKASNHLIAWNRPPGLTLGAGIDIGKNKGRMHTNYFVSLSAYHQKELHYGFELSNSILAQYHLFSKAYLEGGIGIGYLHTFEDAPIYKTKDGQHTQVRDWGRPQMTTHASVGTNVAISEKISIVTNYKFLLQLPFARKAGIIFIPHSRITLGARINFKG